MRRFDIKSRTVTHKTATCLSLPENVRKRPSFAGMVNAFFITSNRERKHFSANSAISLWLTAAGVDLFRIEILPSAVRTINWQNHGFHRIARCAQALSDRRPGGAGPEGHFALGQAWRVDRVDRRVGLGQIDADEHPRLPRSPHDRTILARRPGRRQS